MAKAAWIVTGAVFGFSLLALVSIGVYLLPLALALAVILAAFRVSDAWLFPVAAGTSFALTWLSLVIDPNAPDDSPWPVVVGLLVAVGGWMVHKRMTKVRTPEL